MPANAGTRHGWTREDTAAITTSVRADAPTARSSETCPKIGGLGFRVQGSGFAIVVERFRVSDARRQNTP